MKYLDVLSDGQGITMLIELTSGINSQIRPAFLIFQNYNRICPLRGIYEDVPVVYYSPKYGWIGIFS